MIQTTISNDHLNMEHAMPEQARKSSTRTRLLEAAAALFARKGYGDATVAEICDEAGANISAVNYHFGTKEELYRSAWQYAFKQAIPYPKSAECAGDATPEEHLRRYIFTLIRRIADPENLAFDIMEHEFAHPTGLLRDIVAGEMKPHQAHFNTHIAALLGDSATPERVELCRASIISQCFNLKKLRRLHESHGDLADFAALESGRYAEHVYRFSLGGIAAIREGAQQ
jgi:AcrR family transcriptional regulator